jgi:carbamate kinase
VEVDPDDPSFSNPTKPVGYFYSEEEANQLAETLGWTMREDAGRGWRMVVGSPKPKHICDISLVDVLSSRGTVVIAGGGGGVPVVRDERGVRKGVEAVIDKDLTTAHMANVLGIEEMVILTAVSRVAIHFGSADQQELDTVSVSQVRRYLEEGHFPAGSMGPKIEAAIKFIEGGGKRAIIGHLNEALPAIKGETATHILPD